MKIHEYQAKQIVAKYGVRIPRGEVAHTKEEARAIAKQPGGLVVVKAQIHAGGRGKGGGVKLAKTPDEAEQIAGKMIGMNLITAQTGPEGRTVQKVLIEEGLDIKKELYLGIVIDRQTGKPPSGRSSATSHCVRVRETSREDKARTEHGQRDPISRGRCGRRPEAECRERGG